MTSPMSWIEPDPIPDKIAKSLGAGVTSKNPPLRLPDGRILGFEEYGDPNGQPIFYFHGLCGSRLETNCCEEETRDLGIRVITIDRPGYGESTYKKKRKYLEWPDDVVAVAEHLGISKFGVVGWSSGGPYALACAFKIPDRLLGCCIVSSDVPYKQLTRKQKKFMSSDQRSLWHLSRWYGKHIAEMALQTALSGSDTNPDQFIRDQFKEAPQADKNISTLPRFRNNFVLSFREGVKNGFKPAVHDIKMERRKWGFSVSEIYFPVGVWHGREDNGIPQMFASHMVTMIPRGVLHMMPAEGHVSVWVNHWRNIFREALGHIIPSQPASS